MLNAARQFVAPESRDFRLGNYVTAGFREVEEALRVVEVVAALGRVMEIVFEES